MGKPANSLHHNLGWTLNAAATDSTGIYYDQVCRECTFRFLWTLTTPQGRQLIKHAQQTTPIVILKWMSLRARQILTLQLLNTEENLNSIFPRYEQCTLFFRMTIYWIVSNEPIITNYQVFWNSRLETEHKRIYDLISKQDIVFDVFAGVGPFSVPLAKKGINNNEIYLDEPFLYSFVFHEIIRL